MIAASQESKQVLQPQASEQVFQPQEKRQTQKVTETEPTKKTTTARTYKRVLRTEESLVQEINEGLKKYKLEATEEQRELGVLYLTPKMHKTSPGKRFIAALDKCVTKKLSQLLTKCLREIQKQLKWHCKKEFKPYKVNPFWIVNNSTEVIRIITRQNYQNDTKDLSSHDFSTLYTQLKHEDLKKELKTVIQLAFATRENNKKKLAVHKDNATWIKQGKERTRVVDETELIELVNHLIDNVYVTFGEEVYKQKIGIPMGTDCAPYLANLYLFALEYKWMCGLLADGKLELARRCSKAARLIYRRPFLVQRKRSDRRKQRRDIRLPSSDATKQGKTQSDVPGPRHGNKRWKDSTVTLQ